MSDRRFFRPYQPFNYKPGACIGSLLGEPIPLNVTHVDIWQLEGKIVWHTRSGARHEMDWPSDHDILSIIVAMRISC
jgi:hypothetical protein